MMSFHCCSPGTVLPVSVLIIVTMDSARMRPSQRVRQRCQKWWMWWTSSCYFPQIVLFSGQKVAFTLFLSVLCEFWVYLCTRFWANLSEPESTFVLIHSLLACLGSGWRQTDLGKEKTYQRWMYHPYDFNKQNTFVFYWKEVTFTDTLPP